MEAVWLNGPFGVGKSTVAELVVASCAGWAIYDPEPLGAALLAGQAEADADFQDLPVWRQLVPPAAADAAVDARRGVLIVQAILRVDKWSQLAAGMHERGLRVAHVVLDCEPDELARRIAADTVDPRAAPWRTAHVAAYVDARRWLLGTADLVIDTSAMEASQVADRIIAFLP